MAWKFVDMARSEPTSLAMDAPRPRGPEYPYGLRICLTHDELVRLDFDAEDRPEIGDTVHFVAMAKVTSYSASDGEMGPDCRVELQITHLSIENESTEFADNEAAE